MKLTANFRQLPAEKSVHEKARQRERGDKPKVVHLVFHRVHFVDVEGAAILIDGQDNGEANGRFGSRHHHDEECEQVAGVLFELVRECDEGEVYGIEHQLNRHEDGDDVATQQKTRDAEREQDRAQDKEPGDWYARRQG